VLGTRAIKSEQKVVGMQILHSLKFPKFKKKVLTDF